MSDDLTSKINEEISCLIRGRQFSAGTHYQNGLEQIESLKNYRTSLSHKEKECFDTILIKEYLESNCMGRIKLGMGVILPPDSEVLRKYFMKRI